MIRVEAEPGLTRLILDRPDKANALTAAMLADLDAAVVAATTPVLVLTGAGRVFSVHGQLLAWRADLGLAPTRGLAADDRSRLDHHNGASRRNHGAL